MEREKIHVGRGGRDKCDREREKKKGDGNNGRINLKNRRKKKLPMDFI